MDAIVFNDISLNQTSIFPKALAFLMEFCYIIYVPNTFSFSEYVCVFFFLLYICFFYSRIPQRTFALKLNGRLIPWISFLSISSWLKLLQILVTIFRIFQISHLPRYLLHIYLHIYRWCWSFDCTHSLCSQVVYLFPTFPVSKFVKREINYAWSACREH